MTSDCNFERPIIFDSSMTTSRASDLCALRQAHDASGIQRSDQLTPARRSNTLDDSRDGRVMLHLSSNRHLFHHASSSTKTDLYAAGGLRSHLKHYWPACPSVPVGPDGRPSEFFPGRALRLRAFGHLEYNANTLEHPADTCTQPLPRTLLVSKVRREPGPALSIRYMAAICSSLPHSAKSSGSVDWLVGHAHCSRQGAKSSIKRGISKRQQTWSR